MRYDQVWNWLEDNHPEVICEIGTWNGKNGARMMKLGKCKKYIGFDIWDEGSEELDTIENNTKEKTSLEDARKSFEGMDVELIQGNTRETIREYAKDKEPFIDMVFIDGGHSKHTIRSDFLSVLPMIKDTGVIFMDDYYFNCPAKDVGAQTVLGDVNFPYTVLPVSDVAKDKMIVKIVKINMIDVPRIPKTKMKDGEEWCFTP